MWYYRCLSMRGTSPKTGTGITATQVGSGFLTHTFTDTTYPFPLEQYLGGKASCSDRIMASRSNRQTAKSNPLFENYAHPSRNNRSAIRSSALSTISNYRASESTHRPATTSSF